MKGRTTITIPKTPPSLNTWLGQHWRVRDRQKKLWSHEINAECHRWGLPRCDHIAASIYFRFNDSRKRDHDNFVSTLSKCLGDALRPDFLEDDDSSRFQVIHGEIVSEKGSPLTTILLDWESFDLEVAA